MKRYKVNRGLFLILPVIDISVILLYVLFLFRNSYSWINMVNLIIDAIILVYYLKLFSYEVSIDSKGVNFHTIFGRNRILISQIEKIGYASFLTVIKSDERRFCIITTKDGGIVLRRIFEGIMKDKDKDRD